LKIIGNVLLYIGIWYVNLKFFGYFVDRAFNSPYKDLMDLLFNQWGFGVIIFFVIPVVINLVIFKIRKGNIIEFCRFKAMTLKDTVIVLLVTIAGIIFTLHLINTSFFLKYLPEFDNYVKDAIKGNLFATFFMTGLLLPTCEEILFRGLIFNEMRKGLPVVVVLFLHILIYMPFQPTVSIAVYAYLNFFIYALVFILTDSLWSSIIFEGLGAVGLYATKLLGFDRVIRNWGDPYLITVSIVSLILILIGVFSLRKAPLKEIFSIKTGVSKTSDNVTG
ncbi:MAG: CPBP family intramembrane metalloprotease, partial [Firmicutes bacterium]|nr:CPBP family intramembrane metalloprotease [Bacillota bacterium]